MTRVPGVVPLVLGLAFSAPALGQDSRPPVDRPRTPMEAEVLELEQRAMAAFVHGSPAEFVAATGPAFVRVTPDGAMTFTVDTAAKFMRACRATAFTGSDYRTVPFGTDVIALTYDASIEQLCGERRVRATWHALTVWQRRDGRWSVVAWSHSPPPARLAQPDSSRPLR